MAFPQGINFRSTSGYVTDSADHTFEVYDAAASGTPQYPRTTPQGNTVGYEQGNITTNPRNRNSSNDARLAGIHSATSIDYRIDLPASGSYNIRIALGDGTYSTNTGCELFDGSTSLGTLASGSTGAGNSFRDASNTIRTAAAWPGSNTAVTESFATTIARFRMTGTYAHVYVESAGGGPTDYPLTAESGSFILAGQNTALRVARRVSAESGAYTLTGQAATLRLGRKVQAASGSFALTGTAAVLRVARRLTAESGAFLLTGQDASLVYGSADAILSAESGGFALTGTAAALRVARRLSADSGTFILTGQTATVKADRRLQAETGSFILSGQDAQLEASSPKVLTAESGTFTLAGSDATLTVGRLRRAAGGGGARYAVQIGRKWYFFDDPKDIEELLKEEAQEEAEAIRKPKPRAKIVVKPGAAQVAQAQRTPAPQIESAQHAVRQIYRRAYAQAIQAIEQDEEETLMVLL